MKICALVVTYNRVNLLMENIKALISQNNPGLDIIICDNASTDGTGEEVQRLAKKYPCIKYYNTGSNLGGAGGFEYGLSKIYREIYDFCWIMDDDSVPSPGALASLISAADCIGSENFSFLACNVRWIDDSPCKMNQCVLGTKVRYHSDSDATGIEVSEITKCSFVGCFVNLSVARKVGLPIGEFFIYGDDTEFTLRLSEKKIGYFIEDSIIIHKMPTNVRIGIAEASADRIDRYKFEYRNKMFIYRERCKYGIIKIIKIYLKEALKVIVRSKDNKLKRLEIIRKGFVEGLAFNPQIKF